MKELDARGGVNGSDKQRNKCRLLITDSTANTAHLKGLERVWKRMVCKEAY